MSQPHTDNHAAYLKHWIKAVAADSMVIFSAAKDAEAMAGYMFGIESQHTALKEHAEWGAAYEAELGR